jgi:hypothetical protein
LSRIELLHYVFVKTKPIFRELKEKAMANCAIPISSAYNRTGIMLSRSTNMQLSCNQTTALGRGFNFRQTCQTASENIRENYMSSTYVPLYIERLGPVCS